MTGGFSGGGRAMGLRLPLGETIIAIGVLALAVVIVWQTLSVPVSPLYAKVGPTLFPFITAAGLALLGFLLLVEALRGGWQTAEEKEVRPDRRALIWVTAGLVLNVLLIVPAGFTVASVIMFVCVARGFGSTRILRDAAIGASFALIAYFGFAKTLGMNIGAGLVENAIERVIGTEGS